MFTDFQGTALIKKTILQEFNRLKRALGSSSVWNHQHVHVEVVYNFDQKSSLWWLIIEVTKAHAAGFLGKLIGTIPFISKREKILTLRLKAYILYTQNKDPYCSNITIESIAHPDSGVWGEYFTALARFRQITRILERVSSKIQNKLKVSKGIVIAQENVFEKLKAETVLKQVAAERTVIPKKIVAAKPDVNLQPDSGETWIDEGESVERRVG